MSEYTVRGPRGGALVLRATPERVEVNWELWVKGYGKISIEPYVAPPPPPPPVTLRPFVFVDDEIMQSGNPQAHAWDLASTLVRNRVAGVAIKARSEPAQLQAAQWLAAACSQLGIRFGTWDGAEDSMPPTAVIEFGRACASTWHVVQVESPHQDARWTPQLMGQLPSDRAVIFTEAAWGRDKTKSARWLANGFKAVPEANLAENENATIGAMLDLAINGLGWPPSQVNVALYLIRGTAAARYSAEIAGTGGRWSIFRYGDLDQGDWDTMGAWPRA